jgi:hypothetical protein
MWLMRDGMPDPADALASATDYLDLVALSSMTYMWARMAEFSVGKNEPIHNNKIKTGTYFVGKIMPELIMYSKKVQAGKSSMMDMEVAEF